MYRIRDRIRRIDQMKWIKLASDEVGDVVPVPLATKSGKQIFMYWTGSTPHMCLKTEEGDYIFLKDPYTYGVVKKSSKEEASDFHENWSYFTQAILETYAPDRLIRVEYGDDVMTFTTEDGVFRHVALTLESKKDGTPYQIVSRTPLTA